MPMRLDPVDDVPLSHSAENLFGTCSIITSPVPRTVTEILRLKHLGSLVVLSTDTGT